MASFGGGCDPAKPPRYWAPEAWRLRCALLVARQRLPYHTADARLLDGVERWVLYTGKGKPVPGPWWALAVALASAAASALADADGRVLLAPWCQRGPTPSGETEAFKPLDLG